MWDNRLEIRALTERHDKTVNNCFKMEKMVNKWRKKGEQNVLGPDIVAQRKER